jgi:hypothetical protein
MAALSGRVLGLPTVRAFRGVHSLSLQQLHSWLVQKFNSSLALADQYTRHGLDSVDIASHRHSIRPFEHTASGEPHMVQVLQYIGCLSQLAIKAKVFDSP